VGPERVRFVVRAEDASHPLFLRLLDDAEREYGHAARGIALPCDVDAYLDVLWHMEHRGDASGDDEGDGDGEIPTAVLSPPQIWGLAGLQQGPRRDVQDDEPEVFSVVATIGEHKETKLERTRSYS
jgi:SAUR family protein